MCARNPSALVAQWWSGIPGTLYFSQQPRRWGFRASPGPDQRENLESLVERLPGTEMPMDPLEVRGRRRWPTRIVLRAWVRPHPVVAMVVAVGCGWVMVGAAAVVMAVLLSL